MKKILANIGKFLVIASVVALIGKAAIFGYKAMDKLNNIESGQKKQTSQSDSILEWMVIMNGRYDLINNRLDIRDNNFKALENSHINALKIIDRLDEVIKYYENKAEPKRQQKSTVEIKTKIEKIK